MDKLKSDLRNFWNIGTYYAYKAYHRLMSEALCSVTEGTRGAGLRYIPLKFGKEKTAFSGEVVLGFWNTTLVHLGDMLFHVPLALALKERGYKVTIVGGGGLTDYFKALGLKTVSLPEWLSESVPGSLMISKNDAIWETYRLIGKPVYFLGLDYNWFDNDEPVGLAIIHAVGKVLELLEENGQGGNLLSATKFPPPIPEEITRVAETRDWWKKISPEKPSGWMLFNPYMASNQLMSLGKTEGLISIAKRKKEEGYGIILTGSMKDKAADGRNYIFADLDLRGELSPTDMIALSARGDARGSISYDTFAMHAASLARKDLYVALKDGFRAETFRKRFVPMYPGGEGTVKVCE